MSENRAFPRKVAYAAAVAVLLVPLFLLSQPATTQSEGGVLAQYRKARGLSAANLGEIDPASETMKLATLGLNPIAVTLLWDKANYYKKVENWTSLSAACEQLTRLEPHFAKVWEHQGWNLSYNVAVGFDDYHDRYRWIIKGVNYMKEGVQYNTGNSRLPWYIGWVIAQKIGRADEKVYYRKLFRADDDFHNADDPNRPKSQRDNWLVGHWWFEKGEHVIEQGHPVLGNSALIYYDSKPKCMISYAEALEEDGTFGEVAKIAWERGLAAWLAFGNRDIATGSNNETMRLNDSERLSERLKQSLAELEALAPGGRDKLREERIAKLPARDRDLARTPRNERHADQFAAGDALDAKVAVTYFDVAQTVPESQRVQAMQLAKSISDDEAAVHEIDLDRSQVNFTYSRDHARMERDDETLAARKAIYQAEEALAATRLEQAGRLYDEGFKAWRKALDKFPTIAVDSIMVSDINDTIEKYGEYLRQESKPFPEDFILKDEVLLWQRQNGPGQTRKSVPWLRDDGPPSPPASDATDKPAEKENAKPADKKPAEAAEKPAGDSPQPAPADLDKPAPPATTTEDAQK